MSYMPPLASVFCCSLVGVGYRAAVAGNMLTLNLGYSHPVEMPIPKGVEVKVGLVGRGGNGVGLQFSPKGVEVKVSLMGRGRGGRSVAVLLAAA